MVKTPTFIHAIAAVFSSSFFAPALAAPPNDHLRVQRQAGPVIPTVASPWQYSGCYTDNVNNRTLSVGYGGSAPVTNEVCVSFCGQGGYTYAGTEYSQECYCGRSFGGGSTIAPNSDCNMPCQGNATEACGGPNRLTIFINPDAPVVNPGPGNWGSMGCYTDSVTARTLVVGTAVPGGNGNDTVALCTTACQAGNYMYAGLEYGGECYCGSVFSNGGGPAPDGSTGCSMVCAGNSSEYCGGPNRLDVYGYGFPKPNASSVISSSSMTATKSSTISSTTAVKSTTSSVLRTSTSVGSTAKSNTSKAMSTSTTTSSSAALSTSSTVVRTSTTPSSSTAKSNTSKAVSTSTSAASSGPPSTSSSTAQATATGWVRLGCYTDNVNARTLSVVMNVVGGPGGMTIEACENACQAAGYLLAGVEYSAQCFCDNTLENGGGPAPDGNALCNMACNGNAAENCGGPNRLNLFSRGGIGTSVTTSSIPPMSSSSTSAHPTTSSSTPPIAGWSFLGCYTDSVNARSLSVGMAVPGGPAAMTVELCLAACQAAGYVLAGVEYAQECYCDNTFKNGGGPAPDGNALCDMACNGNAAETCGGPNRLDAYQFNSSGASSATPTQSSGVASSTAPSTATGIPAGWAYYGCWVDSVNGRIMPMVNDLSTQTIEKCIATCIANGNYVAGLEYSTQCFCGDAIYSGGSLASSDSQCNMACGGNAAEICGAGNRMSVYSNQTLQVFQPAVPQSTGLPGSWTYQGCITDDTANRTLPYEIIINDMTPELCLNRCAEYGFMSAGLEYGNQCFCGDPSDVAASDSKAAPATDCNTLCPGNGNYLCGAGNRINYYTWTGGTPLYVFTYASGNSAGLYQFLIGGVVVPLISTPGVNGKITFLEKSGTGPPNSTGAYELDLAMIPQGISAAWRTMHVKTDVFCSAGLTLPDRVGRQIDIGGWSEVSTYGVRLYWPDGSPGKPSYNDWQENQSEVSLQLGRWYPSAMIMANGSMLVVGGESGSNGPPVPSLEILPNPPGGAYITLEFLRVTDPYNLYPFLFVLPSGGIFIGYFNQAQIMDPVTFATLKQLPQIPCHVSDPQGGRNYPLEGTAMLLPQHAPYTDLVTVLICGGSTPNNLALDNCVSIQPDAANPQWVLERMPSKRVISCMTALPDGTYLILNGAVAGQAGFGLASQPNLNAVLYDPSKPIGARMTIMANTTIARLYHSEAVLLLDGRVLVSGSDPEAPGLIQEYRVEVFIPPYLLSGLPQPTFTMSSTDWAYSAQVTFTVVAPSGGPIKVSLMGAESSTHGNSMGARTIFPAISCAGNTCTVTAPPNANVCPPGWFKVYVLDGPTPSVGQFVRIGGDPAKLGNWPSGFADFTVPGVTA